MSPDWCGLLGRLQQGRTYRRRHLDGHESVKLGHFHTGQTPAGLASDGTTIWIANLYDSTVTRLDQKTGKLLGTFATGVNPVGVVYAGTNIWVSNEDGTLCRMQ
jgi:DNA-binding beta-propeller fold protein YncE